MARGFRVRRDPRAADPAGQADQGRQPLQSYDQPQQWPNQDQGTDADPIDGNDPVGDHDDDLEADDDLPVDLPEAKGSEVPEALKAERRKTNQLEHDIRVLKSQLRSSPRSTPTNTNASRTPNAKRWSWSGN